MYTNYLRQLRFKTFEQQALDLNCHLFDVVSAYSDFIIQGSFGEHNQYLRILASPCDLNFDLSLAEAAKQQYVKLEDVLDFGVILLQNENTSVIDLFLVGATPSSSTAYINVFRRNSGLPVKFSSTAFLSTVLSPIMILSVI